MQTGTQQVGTPEKRAMNRWWVASGTAGVGYTVKWLPTERRYRCVCSGFRFRKRCRHIDAVKAMRKEVPMG
jgi:hypothetical protein